MNDNALKLFKVNNKDKTTFLLDFMSFWLIQSTVDQWTLLLCPYN